MHIVYKLILAAKYLLGYFRRFIFLLGILSFGFAIITAMTLLAEGMSESVFMASQNHYSGHIFVLGFDKKARTQGRITDAEIILESVRESGISPLRIVQRTLSFQEGILYFAGSQVRQKYVFGIDWKAEKENFKELFFTEGGMEGVDAVDSILISEAVAKKLHARAGDDLILEVLTGTGQRNTQTFIVKGIFQDNTIFGYYKCFVERHSLNRLLAYGRDDCSSIGIYFSGPDNLAEKTKQLYQVLKTRLPVGPPIHTKEELTYQLSRDWEGIRYFTIPLDVYISQVADLLSGMKIASYFLYGMMIIIIHASILVTYNLILHERSVEIGTMHALGVQSHDMQSILILESGMLFLAALISGFVFSLFIVGILSSFSYTGIPGFEIFMRKGRLSASFSCKTILTNIFILVIISLPAVWIPAFQTCRKDLSKILSRGNT